MKPLSPLLLQKREYRRVAYDVTVPYGVSFEALLEPKFWANHADTIKVGDTVFVAAHDLSFVADLIAVDVMRGFVAMEVLWRKTFAERATASEAVIAAGQAGGADFTSPPKELPGLHYAANAWRLIGHDSKEVAKYPTKDKADAALADYVKRSKGKAAESKAAA